MKFVGVDLHKKTIVVCVMIQAAGKRKVIARRHLYCNQPETIEAFFRKLGVFRVVVEATAAYEWFVRLVEPLAERVVLAHPKKLRVIAESKRKTDKLDAQVLAEQLLLDQVPEARRPTPRQREHRALVRQRKSIQGRITSVKNKIRHVLSQYNADIAGLFSRAGRQHIKRVEVSIADRIVLEQLEQQLDFFSGQLREIDKHLADFGKSAPLIERERREVLASMPCVGPVTIDVVLSEFNPDNFRGAKKAVAYAGLAPGVRQSSNRRKELGITKEGSRLLRWSLVELAWRLVGKSRRWGSLYEKLKQRSGPKKAIVAVARRVFCVIFSMLKNGNRYNLLTDQMPAPA